MDLSYVSPTILVKLNYLSLSKHDSLRAVGVL